MSHTVLLADDSKTISKAVEIALAKEPFSVVVVNNADAAIAQARETPPSLVLADHAMPGKSGYEVAEALRADPATAKIPVLLLSGTSVPFDEGRCQASGAVGHLPKPFDCQTLIDKVSELVGGVTDAERMAAASAPAVAAPSAAGAALPRPPGPTPSAPRPSQPADLSNIGFTSTPISSATPLAGDDSSFSIDIGPEAVGVRPSTPKPAAPVQAARVQAAQGQAAQVQGQQSALATPARAVTSTPPGVPVVASTVVGPAAEAVASSLSAAGVQSSEAISAATREIIERVVWEVVPELAETLIREELERLLKPQAG